MFSCENLSIFINKESILLFNILTLQFPSLNILYLSLDEVKIMHSDAIYAFENLMQRQLKIYNFHAVYSF